MTEEKSTILHIDDDEANRYAVRRILEKNGYYIIDAANGTDGIELAKKADPDLIILDIKLPDINGFEVCKRLKNDPATSKITILQTSASFVSADNKVTGLESGADGYLAQPIEASVLVATVKSLLRTRIAEKLATEAVKSREQVLAIVSHDLRNPISFIMLQSKLMETALLSGKLTMEDAVLRMKKVNKSCIKMNRLISDILDVSKLDQGKIVLDKKHFLVKDLVEDIIIFYEDLALQSEISLVAENNCPPDFSITGDVERLQQVFSNIIANSLKFTPSGGEIKFNIQPKGNFVCFTIKDSGTGIAAKDLPHVFNRFWQGHPERQTGYGIGLSIVKGITEAHGGKIHISSLEGEGTTVTVEIPFSAP